MALNETGSFKLGQYPVHCCQADFDTLLQQCFVNILSGQMTLGVGPVFKHLKNLDSRRGDFESSLFDVLAFLLSDIFWHDAIPPARFLSLESGIMVF